MFFFFSIGNISERALRARILNLARINFTRNMRNESVYTRYITGANIVAPAIRVSTLITAFNWSRN